MKESSKNSVQSNPVPAHIAMLYPTVPASLIRYSYTYSNNNYLVSHVSKICLCNVTDRKKS